MRALHVFLMALVVFVVATQSAAAEDAANVTVLSNLTLTQDTSGNNTPYPLLVFPDEPCAYAENNQSGSCGVFQPVCDFIQGIIQSAVSSITSWLSNALDEFRTGVEGVVNGVASGIGDAYASLALRIPVFRDPDVSFAPYTTAFSAMDDVYCKAVWVAFCLLGVAVFLSGLALMLEAGGVVREGEAMATLKRALLAAALIMLSRHVYNYFAAGAAYVTYAIAPLDLVSDYVSKAALLLVGGWIAIAIFSLGQAIQVLLLFSFLFLFAAAGRFLISAAIAALLPVVLALSVFPFQTVRRVGIRLLSVLAAFTFVPVLAAAVLAIGAEAFTILTPGDVYGPWTAGWWANFVIATVMFFTALGAPLIAMLVVSEAGIGMAFASYAMMYAAYPMIRAVSQVPGKTVKAVAAAAGGPAGTAAAASGEGGPASRLREVSASWTNFIPSRSPPQPLHRGTLDAI